VKLSRYGSGQPHPGGNPSDHSGQRKGAAKALENRQEGSPAGSPKPGVSPSLRLRLAAFLLWGYGSGPGRENFLGLHHLVRGAGELILVLSGPAGDVNHDGFQAAGFHLQTELLVDFLHSMLLQAIGHASASAHANHIAMLNAAYFQHACGSTPKAAREAFAADAL
jgi:hypothetical protein